MKKKKILIPLAILLLALSASAIIYFTTRDRPDPPPESIDYQAGYLTPTPEYPEAEDDLMPPETEDSTLPSTEENGSQETGTQDPSVTEPIVTSPPTTEQQHAAAGWSIGDPWPEHLPYHESGSINLRSPGHFEELFELPFTLQHRAIFYQIPPDISDLVADQGAVRAWMETHMWGAGTQLYPMLLMRFVQHFNIPKADFVSAVEATRARIISAGFDIGDENYELPNADIIYTFNPELISHFYRLA